MHNSLNLQESLFPRAEDDAGGRSTGVNLELRDADVTFFERFFSPENSAVYFERLKKDTAWRQDKITFYGREMNLPRRTAWYGAAGKRYVFSGIAFEPLPFTETLLEIKRAVEERSKATFNCVLLNFYRDGKDGIAPHADDEPELGIDPAIGSVSFGGARRFILRHKTERQLKTEILLTDGSYLLMKGKTQTFWRHSIPKTAKRVDERINLTFRTII